MVVRSSPTPLSQVLTDAVETVKAMALEVSKKMEEKVGPPLGTWHWEGRCAGTLFRLKGRKLIAPVQEDTPKIPYGGLTGAKDPETLLRALPGLRPLSENRFFARKGRTLASSP